MNNNHVGSVNVVPSMNGRYRRGILSARKISPLNNTANCVGLSDMNRTTSKNLPIGSSHRNGHVEIDISMVDKT